MIALVVAATVFVHGIIAGSPDLLTKMIPSDAAIYSTVYLDPSASQKLNLNNVLSHFPQVKDQGTRDPLAARPRNGRRG